MLQKATKRHFILGAAAGLSAAWALRPASTPPVEKSKTNPKATPIAKLESVFIGGNKQWLLQRGADSANPLLLYIHGGPGISEMAFNRKHSKALEQDFVVVNWDQRGAGKSRQAIQDTGKMSIPQIISDLREVVQYLLHKFGKKRLTLVGRSWGSAIGLQAVADFPELFEAYVGIGQLTDVLKSEQAGYQWTLETAMVRNDRQAAEDLLQMGAPPYDGDWLKKFMTQRKYVCRFGGELVGNRHGSNLMLAQSVLFGAEYTLADKLHYYHCATESLRLLQPQLMKLNLFETAGSIAVPLFFMAGRQDQVVPQQIAHAYYESVKAPQKQWHWFEHSAHMPDVEEPEKFTKLMLQQVRPLSVESL